MNQKTKQNKARINPDPTDIAVKLLTPDTTFFAMLYTPATTVSNCCLREESNSVSAIFGATFCTAFAGDGVQLLLHAFFARKYMSWFFKLHISIKSFLTTLSATLNCVQL